MAQKAKNEFLRHLKLRGIYLAEEGFSHLVPLTGGFFSAEKPSFVPMSNGLNVLVGRNGSGKSTFLEILELAAFGKGSPFEGLVYEIDREYLERAWGSGIIYRPYDDGSEDHADGEISNFFSGAESWPFNRSQEILNEWLMTPLVMITRPVGGFVYGPESWPINLANLSRHEQEMSKYEAETFLDLVPVIALNEDSPFTSSQMRLYRDLTSKVVDACNLMTGRKSGFDGNSFQEREALISEMGFEEFPSDSAMLLNIRNFWRFRDNNQEELRESASVGFAFLPPIEVVFTINQLSHVAFEPNADFSSEMIILSDGVESGIPKSSRLSLDDVLASVVHLELFGAAAEDQSLYTFESRVRQQLAPAFPKFVDLKIRAGQEFDWLRGIKPSWEIGSKGVSRLSQSEKRWLSIASRNTFSEPDLLLIDEPEMGLDRNAERVIARALGAGSFGNNPIVVASHSPEVHGIQSAQYLLVNEGRVTSFDKSQVEIFESLGFSPSDLVTLIRCVLAVEGPHDSAILNHFIGEELARLHVLMMPMHGGSKFSNLPQFELLPNITSAPMVVLTDNIPMETVRAAHMQAFTQAALGSGYLEMKSAINEAAGAHSDADEMAFVTSYLIAISRSVDPSRYHVAGLARKDILEYLNPQDFGVPEAISWDDLRQEWQDSAEKSKGVKFKSWVGLKFPNAQIHELSIKRAISRTNAPMHDDLKDLVRFLAELTGQKSIEP